MLTNIMVIAVTYFTANLAPVDRWRSVIGWRKICLLVSAMSTEVTTDVVTTNTPIIIWNVVLLAWVGPKTEPMHINLKSISSCATEKHVVVVATNPARPAVNLPMCLMKMLVLCAKGQHTAMYLSVEVRQCTKSITIHPESIRTPIIRFHSVDKLAEALRIAHSSQLAASIELTLSHIST